MTNWTKQHFSSFHVLWELGILIHAILLIIQSLKNRLITDYKTVKFNFVFYIPLHEKLFKT